MATLVNQHQDESNFLLLESLLSVSNTEFLRSYWGVEPLISKFPQADITTIFAWDVLGHLLSTQRYDFPRLRLVRGGSVIPARQYISRRCDRRGSSYHTHNSKAVESLLEQGAMLHLASVQESWPPLATLCSGLELELGGSIQANLHAGYSGSLGFNTHWDGHDVLVLQVYGAKEWRFYGITEESPLPVPPDAKPDPPLKPVKEFTLNEGEVLYLPRGYWHAASAQASKPTMHITLAIQHATGLDYLEWLKRRLESEVTLRKDVRRFTDLSSESEKEAYVSDLRRILLAEVSGDTLGEYLDEHRKLLGQNNNASLSLQRG